MVVLGVLLTVGCSCWGLYDAWYRGSNGGTVALFSPVEVQAISPLRGFISLVLRWVL